MHEGVWDGVMLGYNILLCCMLMFFAYQNSRIKAHFQQEGEFATKAVVLVFLFVFVGSVLLFLLNQKADKINEYFWVFSTFVLVTPIGILAALFIPKVRAYCLCRTHRKVNDLYSEVCRDTSGQEDDSQKDKTRCCQQSVYWEVQEKNGRNWCAERRAHPGESLESFIIIHFQ